MHTSEAQKGYTLLEVLIASAIFVGVLVIATSTFTTSNRLRDTTLQQQETTQTARFIAETLARDVRAATGERSSGALIADPFEFLDGDSVLITPTSGLIASTSLRTYRFDPTIGNNGQLVERRYVFTESDPGDFTISKDGAAAESLLPTGFAISDVEFRGLSHGVQGLRSQPFVQFEFTVTHIQSGTSQTIRSSVSSRELL